MRSLVVNSLGLPCTYMYVVFDRIVCYNYVANSHVHVYTWTTEGIVCSWDYRFMHFLA